MNLNFEEILERTIKEIDILRTAPLGTIIEDFEIEDEKERTRLLKIADECLQSCRKSRKEFVISKYQKKSILFADDFMN